VFFVFYAWFVFFIPNYLLDADNSNPANPLVTPAHIVPEWYLLPFYAILRAIPDKLAGVAALGAAIVLLAFLPWLDWSRVKSGKYRPIFRFFFGIFVICCVGLGYLGSQEVSDTATLAARIFTVGYFGYLLVILPLLGFIERGKNVPSTIADAVLRKHAAAAAPAE
jgi:ubiquinol-cytochrome c reductase cytochrome b subunit